MVRFPLPCLITGGYVTWFTRVSGLTALLFHGCEAEDTHLPGLLRAKARDANEGEVASGLVPLGCLVWGMLLGDALDLTLDELIYLCMCTYESGG